MSFRYEDRNRQAVPRCLPYKTACALGLLRANRIIKEKQLALKETNSRAEWIESHRVITAVDFVAEAMILSDFQSDEAIEAANFILKHAPASSLLIRQLANHFLEEPVSNWNDPGDIQDIDTIRREIGDLKRSVRSYMTNPIEWSNLSIKYATIGQNDKAKMAMKIALNLAPKNRFILRSASRCLLHVGEPDNGVAVLDKSGLCAFDPWIASAELAISQIAGLKSKYIGKAKDLIEDENLTPFSRSELSLGIGTLELKTGSVRKAKKIIKKALVDPTENALAQTEWAASTFKIDFDDTKGLRKTVPASYEASAVYSFYKKDFEESLQASKKWAKFQFLSDRPIILSTFISSCLLNNDEEAINIYENALPAQQKSPIVINNLAFALARIGKIERAKRELSKVARLKLVEEEKPTITATLGLIQFRESNIELGRELYRTAIREFELENSLYSAAIAKYYWALEEKRINSDYSITLIKEAKREIEKQNVFEFLDLAKKL